MRRNAQKWTRQAVALVVAALCCAATTSSAFADATPSFIPPDADWLTTINYYRAMAALPPVVEDPYLSGGSYNHSCYMLQNGIAHDEIPGKPGYTAEGDLAGNSGNVAVSSVYGTSPRAHIELWMTGPFHTIGVLRPNLQRVGFGKCDNPATAPWRSAATLDVLRGLGTVPPQTTPILFPGDGTTTSLDKFVVESPDPLAFCGWTGEAGLPIIAMMPEGLGGQPNATLRSSSGPLSICVLTQYNTTGVASAILAGNNAVVIMPRSRLASDTYTVAVGTQARTVGWSFTVDPAAATGVQPSPTTTALGDSGSFQPITPARVVDTRVNLGTTRLVGGASKRIQISGKGGVPTDAHAISANFTVVNSSGGGFLTVWNCSANRPTVSTLNFGPGETVPNGSSVPLDASGGICVFSPSSTDLIVDVNGYYADAATGHFAAVVPTRLMDTRTPLGAPGRLRADTVTRLRVTGTAGIPTGAMAVMLNVTSLYPSTPGYVTVFPCDVSMPLVSSLNPFPWSIKPNNVVTPVATDGTVCIYVSTDVDLIVDVTGYVKPSAPLLFTPSLPFRLLDTRDRYRPDMNGGNDGQPAQQGQTIIIQVAGARGIASDAKAVSANITVVGAYGPGYVTVWQCGTQPGTSNVNYQIYAAIANGAQLPLSSSGKLCVYVSSTTHVIIDVNGWWS